MPEISFQQLAKELIKDAEGATKFITVVVKEGRDKDECSKGGFQCRRITLGKPLSLRQTPIGKNTSRDR